MDLRGLNQAPFAASTSTGRMSGGEAMGPFLDKGDILGHEAIWVVEEVGSEVTELRAGQRRGADEV